MSLVSSAYFRIFEPFLAFSEETRARTTHALRAARIGMFPEWYLSLSYLSSVIAGVGCAVAVGAASAFILPSGSLLLRGALVVGAGIVASLAVRLGFLVYPRIVASSRARQIDAEFSSVVMLCYALARGGMSSPAIFRVIAEERETYGEISNEFGLVMRDVEQLGQDLNSALQSVASTTPSGVLRGFFQGLVTILNSGADPRDYFKRQAETQLSQADLSMDKEIEQAGLLAETYVSGLLVLPLLLIVILTVLSALGGGNTTMVPLIIFGLVPGGTFGYLVLLDMMVPPAPLGIPMKPSETKSDFGVDTVSPDIPLLPPPGNPSVQDLAAELDRTILAGGDEAARATQLRRRLLVEWARRRTSAAWTTFVDKSVTMPTSILPWSGTAGAILLAVGAFIFTSGGTRGQALVVSMSGLVLAAAVVAALPVSVFHEMRVQRARRLEGELPETLSKLSGFNERGVGLLRSFQILGQSSNGPLAQEFSTLDRDVSWTGNLWGALRRMRARMSSKRITKLCILLERGTAATGNLKEVLDIAASEASTTESQGSRKRQSMMSYVVVVYVVFAVFLYVVYSIVDLFYGASGFTSLQSSSSRAASVLGKGYSADTAEILYFHAVLIQGACCGLVAGKLGEGHILSGLKHAAILSILAWGIFQVWVF